jgi:uncharacterized membrane protein YkvA (DUF1232 family)
MDFDTVASEVVHYLATRAKRFGLAVLQQSLLLVYTMVAAKTPFRVRTAIAGAITYLVWPADAIPDLLPFTGFTDDLTAIGVCFAAAAGHITDDVRAKAQKTLDHICATGSR